MSDLILIESINEADRLRPVDAAWVAALVESIRDHGLEQPIIVRPAAEDLSSFILVAGMHRLAAFRAIGKKEIPAIVRELTADEARLVEIDENLMRRELSPLDRAVFLSERKVVWERLHPQVAHGGARRRRAKQGEFQVANLATRFSKEVADKVGLSERAVRRACQIFAELGPAAVATLRGTALADNQAQLLALARLGPDARQMVIASAASSDRIKTVSAALRATNAAPAKNLNEETFRKLLDLWSRAGAKVRRRFLAEIGAEIAPKS